MTAGVVLAAPGLPLAPAPVPEEVTIGLPSAGIEVADAGDVPIGSLAVSSQRAVRAATRNFGGFARPYGSGWTRVDRVSVHLVRIVSSSGSALCPGEVVWLVVIRDVSIPDLWPPRPGQRRPRVFIEWLAVFVRTDAPRYLVAASF
jgi:hypothetical protein